MQERPRPESNPYGCVETVAVYAHCGEPPYKIYFDHMNNNIFATDNYVALWDKPAMGESS